jgi:tRNA 2-thiocytidine biosynthesis protein TtcA
MAALEGLGFYISKKIGKAIIDYNMLAEGDKVAVAVSGGKDSLSLLHILNERRAFVPIKYDLVAIHIDSGYPHSYSKKLEAYFRKAKINYHIEKIDALKNTKKKDINCFWCSWNRRKALFETVDRLGIKKIALGHHKDDIVETILLNLFFHGEISSMNPRQELFSGRIVIIRPLAYVEEDLLRRFAKQQKFPNDNCRCPNSLISHRSKISRIIKELEKTCPEVKTNIFRSIKRINKDYLL